MTGRLTSTVWPSVLAFLLLAFSGAGCSTVRPSHSSRLGLIDRMKKMDRESGGASREVASGGGDADDGEVAPDPEQDARLEKLRGVLARWRWPLRAVEVTSPFGQRGHEFHEGIDLRAKTGTAVYAAADGRVVYAGRKIRGYGKMIVIKHTSGLSSVYAHNSNILVRAGQTIRQGQRIAISGRTGHVSGPHLHFEVREGVTAVDPQKLMPARNVALGPAPSPAHLAVAHRHRTRKYASRN